MNTKPDCQTDLDRVLAEALMLSVADREKLLESLLASLDGPFENDDPGPCFATPELEREWIEESHRRLTLMMSGAMASFSSEEVFARWEASLRR